MKLQSVIIVTMWFVFINTPIYTQTELPEIEVTKLSPGLYKFHYGVNNWLILIGTEGILFSDSAPEIYAEAIKSELKKLSKGKIKFIINTHWHHDHTGGNLMFGRDATIIAHSSVRNHLMNEQVISSFGEKFKAYPAYACPDLLFFDRLKIYFNGEEINVIHMPNGHTTGDAVVYFKNANVLHIGDLYVSGQFPSVDLDHGGNVQYLARNLETIIKIMPSDVKIVSGHLSDATIENLRDYITMLNTTMKTVQNEIQKGKTLIEMQKGKILSDWEDWGKHVTTDMWIEMIYRSLTANIIQRGKQ